MKNKVSIVTICYNAGKVIESTILSVIGQTYDNKEYILIDGGSEDNTIDIIYKYREKIDNFVSEPDRGIYDAMNKGIKAATGDWIIFMNAGDRFVNASVLERIFEDNLYSNDIGFIYGNSYVTNGVLAKLYKPTSPFWENKSYLHSSGICHQSSFVNREIALNTLFDLNYKHAADFKMFLDVYKKGYLFKYVDVNVCIFDITDNFGTRNPWSGVIEQAKILNHYKTVRFYIAIAKDAIYTKPIAKLIPIYKSCLNMISPQAYKLFLQKRGWIPLSSIVE